MRTWEEQQRNVQTCWTHGCFVDSVVTQQLQNQHHNYNHYWRHIIIIIINQSPLLAFDLSLGHLPDQGWRRRPGGPSNRWIDQVRRDNTTYHQLICGGDPSCEVIRGGDATVLADYALTTTASMKKSNHIVCYYARIQMRNYWQVVTGYIKNRMLYTSGAT